MAFLGGFLGSSKSNTTTSNTTATTVDNEVSVEVQAEISPVINTAVDLTGFSDAVSKVAQALNTVVESATKKDQPKEQTGLEKLSALGSAATAILAMMAIYFAVKDPQNVKVQL